MELRTRKVEQYVPDVEDNRARHARGEAAVVVEIKPPSSYDIRQLWSRMAADIPAGTVGAAQAMMALLNDTTVEPFWLACVGAITGLTDDVGQPIPDGATLWARRKELVGNEAAALINDVLAAVNARAKLEAGLVRFLGSASGPPVSLSLNGGTAPPAAVPVT